MKLYPFTKTYAGVRVLDFPGMELQKGSIYGVIGSNGSGKSTLAKVLAGIIPADNKGKTSDAVSVGYMPQKNFAFRMSVKKNILLGGGDEAGAAMLMDKMGIAGLSGKRADRLSGGETARMALLRLMMREHELLVLDEPCASMDMETTKISEEIIKDYVKETDCTLILITHSLSQAERMCDVIMFFNKGGLIEYAPTEKLLRSPEKEETKQFLDFYKL